MRDIIELWYMADSILTRVKTTRYSQSSGGNGIKFESHENWALTFRRYATEAEHKTLTAAIRGERPAGLEQMIKHFRRRLPGAIVERGYDLQEIL